MQFYRFVRGGVGLFGLAAIILGTGAGRASAQSVYEGALTNQQAAEVVSWSTLYWQRVDQGGGSPGTGFSFSTASMNSALFNPLRGTRTTLEKVGSVSASACDELGSTATAITTDQIALRGVFKKAMLEGKIQTDAYTNTSGTVQHANLILAAPASAGMTVYVDGTKLVSLDLPLAKVDATAYQATLAMNLSTQSQNLIAAMIASGATWAANAGTVTESQKAITGQQSRADRFATTVQVLLNAVGVSNSSTQVISAHFGVYGELPIVAVQLGDSMVLMDPLNGNLSGPFATNSALDATGLLSAYPSIYAAGASVGYFTASGCPTTISASWHPSGPTGWLTCPGCGPWTPWTVPIMITSFECLGEAPSPNGSTPCTCTATGTATDPSGRTVPVRIVCTCTSCGGTGMGTGPGLGPNVPPGTPAAPGVAPGSPAASCTCGTTEYLY